MRIYIDVNLAYSSILLSYISRLESCKKLPPGKEKNGLRLADRRYDTVWVFSQKLMLAEPSFALSKHRICH